MVTATECPQCRGAGEYAYPGDGLRTTPCAKCNGTGFIRSGHDWDAEVRAYASGLPAKPSTHQRTEESADHSTVWTFRHYRASFRAFWDRHGNGKAEDKRAAFTAWRKMRQGEK